MRSTTAAAMRPAAFQLAAAGLVQLKHGMHWLWHSQSSFEDMQVEPTKLTDAVEDSTADACCTAISAAPQWIPTRGLVVPPDQLEPESLDS